MLCVEIFKVHFSRKKNKTIIKPQLCTESAKGRLKAKRKIVFNSHFHYFLSNKMGYHLDYNMNMVKRSLKSAEAVQDIE